MTEINVIESAGGVLARESSTGTEVLLVHQVHPWTGWGFPKGTLEEGESPEEGAVREVEEETGVVASPGEFLGSIEYPNGDATERVSYYRMSVVRDLGFAPSKEVDEIRWVPLDEARGMLRFENLKEILSGV